MHRVLLACVIEFSNFPVPRQQLKVILIGKIAVYVIEAVSFFCDSKIYKLNYDLELSCHVVMVNFNILLHIFENYEQYAAIALAFDFFLNIC